MNRDALSKYFLDVHSSPTRLGGIDCVRFVIDALYIGWNIDLRPMLGYHDRRSAVDRLRIADGLRQAFIDDLGDPVSEDQLEPGDIAYFDDPCVGLVMQDYIAVKFGRTIVRAPRNFCDIGWKTWRL